MFYFKMGNVETKTPWQRPTMETFALWWEQIKNYDKIKDYNIILSGAFAEKIWGHYDSDTWDVDIIVTNMPHGPIHLRNLLELMIQIGLNNELLVDAFYQDWLFEGVNFTPFVKYRISDGWYKERGDEVLKWKFISDNTTELIPGLWSYEYTQPPHSWNKWVYRLMNYKYKGIKIDLHKEFRWV